MSAIRILGITRSNYVQSVVMVLREKGVDHEVVAPVGGLGTPEHLALHPWGKIPVLVADGVTLFETSAILRWIEATHPTPALLPTGATAAARVEQWISAINAYLDRRVMREIAVPLLRARRDGGTFAPSPETLAALARDLDVFAAALEPGPYLAGDAPTLADFLLAPILAYADLIEIIRAEIAARPSLGRFLDAMRARPSSDGVLRRPN